MADLTPKPLSGVKRGFTSLPAPSNASAGFSILTYNILSDSSAKPNFFTKVKDQSCLKWDRRRHILAAQIEALNPDVVCLQEVDHYQDFFHKHMTKLGYECYYAKRPGQKPDGCATFFRRSKFMLYQVLHLELDNAEKFAGSSGAINIEPEEPYTCTVASLFAVMPSNTDDVIVVTNTHLFWHPSSARTRLRHAMLIKEQAAALADTHGAKAIFCCGDYNCDSASEAIQFKANGANDFISQQWKEFSHIHESIVPLTITAQPKATVAASKKPQPSVLTDIPDHCSIWTPQIKDFIDWIFYSTSGPYRPTFILNVPTKEALHTAVGPAMPTTADPSDHLPLFAVFSIVPE